MSTMEVPLTGAGGVIGPPVPPTVLPSNMQLQRNPMLPQHPLGAYTDAQYEAADAMLRNQIAKQYADILQQLGYVDNNGNFVQGSVEAEANRQKADLNRSADLAGEDVTKQHQQLGTLFSGLRGTDLARAQYPYVNQISQLETQTPLTLQQLYEKAAGLVSDYTLQQNRELADAAARQAAGLSANPPGVATPGDVGAVAAGTDGSGAALGGDALGRGTTDQAAAAGLLGGTPTAGTDALSRGTTAQAAGAGLLPAPQADTMGRATPAQTAAALPIVAPVPAVGNLTHSMPVPSTLMAALTPNNSAITGAINSRRPGIQM